MINNNIPFKQAAVSVSRFNDMAIPHHLGLLNNHRSNIEKSLALGDWSKIRKEEINALRVIKQIKNLMLEMDALREKLAESDQLQFDAMLEIGRQKAFGGMKQYMELDLKTPRKSLRSRVNSAGWDSDEDDEELYEHECAKSVPIGQTRAHQRTLPAIETDFEQEKFVVEQREACLVELETLQHEIRDLNDMFQNMSELVHEQSDFVENIADNAEEALEQVQQGERSLQRALKYKKKAMYPMVGALIGSCVGGPIGLVAGLKAGGLAAVGCGILGFTGGSVLKSNPEILQGDIVVEEVALPELQTAKSTADTRNE